MASSHSFFLAKILREPGLLESRVACSETDEQGRQVRTALGPSRISLVDGLVPCLQMDSFHAVLSGRKSISLAKGYG